MLEDVDNENAKYRNKESIDIHAAKQVMMVCNNVIDVWTHVIICRQEIERVSFDFE